MAFSSRDTLSLYIPNNPRAIKFLNCSVFLIEFIPLWSYLLSSLKFFSFFPSPPSSHPAQVQTQVKTFVSVWTSRALANGSDSDLSAQQIPRVGVRVSECVGGMLAMHPPANLKASISSANWRDSPLVPLIARVTVLQWGGEGKKKKKRLSVSSFTQRYE